MILIKYNVKAVNTVTLFWIKTINSRNGTSYTLRVTNAKKVFAKTELITVFFLIF